MFYKLIFAAFIVALATAILDRLLHRIELIQMDDESYRMKHIGDEFSSRDRCRILSRSICRKPIGRMYRILLDGTNYSPLLNILQPLNINSISKSLGNQKILFLLLTYIYNFPTSA